MDAPLTVILPCGCVPGLAQYCSIGRKLWRAVKKANKRNLTGRASFAETTEKRKAFENHLRGAALAFHDLSVTRETTG